jgi:hypothetical protein
MSLYREPGRRRVWPAAVAAGVLLLALGAGFALGRATSDTSLANRLEPTGRRVDEVLAALEQLTIEYPQGAEAASEYQGASATAERMQRAFGDARGDLLLLDAEATRTAETALDEVASLVESRARTTELEAAVGRAEAAVRALPTAG